MSKNVECFNRIFFKIQNNISQALKIIAREIIRAECAKCNDRVSRRFMLGCTPSGVAFDGRCAAVGMTGVSTGIGGRPQG